MKIVLFVMAVICIACILVTVVAVRTARKNRRDNEVLVNVCKNFRQKKYVKDYYKRKGWRIRRNERN